MKKIVILGGGFGGLYTALRLKELPWTTQPEITLVEKNDRFVFSPLLYELITEEMQSWEVAPYYSDLLANSPIRFIQDTVASVDDEQQEVVLENNGSLKYDRLVVALGGKTPTDMVEGAKEYALPFRSLDHAYTLKEKLRSLENSDQESIRVAIVGGGYSGVELALKIADRLGDKGRIRIIDRNSDILSDSPSFNQEKAKKALADREIWSDLETDVVNITANEISLDYKGQIDTIPTDIVLWTVGTSPTTIENNLPFPKNDRGQIQVNSKLQIENHPHVFALGDLILSQDQDGNQLPATAQVAFQQSDYCGWNLWATIEEKPLLDFKYQPLGEMLALGDNDATLSGLGVSIDGGLAYFARRLVYLYRLPTVEHQMAVALNWITNPISSFLNSLSA